MGYNQALGNGDDAASRWRADFMQRMKVDQALFTSLIVQRKMVWPLTFICSAVFIRTETLLCVKETCCGFQSLLLFSVKCAEHLVRLKLVLGICLLLVSSPDFVINTLFFIFFIFPDWRLWPTDMGEISGAERNKGLYPPHFHVLFWFFCFFAIFIFLFVSPSVHPSCLVVPFALSLPFYSVFILPSLLFLCFLLTLSFLPSWLCVICPFVLTSPPSSFSCHLFLFLSSVYFSGEYTAGRMFLLLSRSACLLIVRCRQSRLSLVIGFLSCSFSGSQLHSCDQSVLCVSLITDLTTCIPNI